MLPLLAAREIRETVLDYLRSTWQLADQPLEKALLAFLAGDHGMFKGPWVASRSRSRSRRRRRRSR